MFYKLGFSGTASPPSQFLWGFSRFFDWNPFGSQCLFRFPTNSVQYSDNDHIVIINDTIITPKLPDSEKFANVSPICRFRFEDWNKVDVEGTGVKEWQVTGQYSFQIFVIRKIIGELMNSLANN